MIFSKLWAINEENYLCFREGITNENLSGQNWKEISLKIKHPEKEFINFTNFNDSEEFTKSAKLDENENIIENKIIKEAEPIKQIIDLDNEISIYDTEFTSSNNQYFGNLREVSKDKSNQESVKDEQVKLVVKDPTITIEYENIKRNEENCNALIEKLKLEEENSLKNESIIRSSSTVSTVSSSIGSEFMYSVKKRNSLIEDNFEDVIFKFVDASAFNLELNAIPKIWTENFEIKKRSFSNLLVENEIDKKSEWRTKIYNAIKIRNSISIKDNNKFQKAIEEVKFILVIKSFVLIFNKITHFRNIGQLLVNLSMCINLPKLFYVLLKYSQN